jgi:predicted NBD/HSP70 family sugar kinase
MNTNSPLKEPLSSLVIDIGGTHIRCAGADENASLFYVRKSTIASFASRRSPERVWKEIFDIISGYELAHKKILSKEAPAVISFPGPVAYPSRVLSAPTIVGKDAEMPDLQHEITKLTGRTAYIINDISAATWYISRTIPSDRFLVVTVSSGIGSKLFDRRHPLPVFDNVPFAGEIGHVKVDPSDGAMSCDCGGRGHLGAISSGRGIERFARQQAIVDKKRFESSLCVTQYHAAADTLTNEEHIVPAALLRDDWALEVIKKCTGPLARILLTVTAACGLDRIVVIGGFALSLGRTYLDILQNEMVGNCDFKVLSDKLPDLLVMGSANEEACLQGAAVYAVSIRSRSKHIPDNNIRG